MSYFNPARIHFDTLCMVYGKKCAWCKSVEHLCVDHIIPRHYGGSDELENLQILCRSCNSSKGAGRDPYRKGCFREGRKIPHDVWEFFLPSSKQPPSTLPISLVSRYLLKPVFDLRWGLGRVVQVEESGVLTIEFKRFGTKQLLASWPTLTVLSTHKLVVKYAGKFVRHEKYGVGRVLEVAPSGQDAELTVEFKHGGVRKLLASFANLTVIEPRKSE